MTNERQVGKFSVNFFQRVRVTDVNGGDKTSGREKVTVVPLPSW
jgi:hypothetical protein